jgi:hypothetical protein
LARAHAQSKTTDLDARVLFVNDEWERYTRILQLSGDAPLYPWSVRGFGLAEMPVVAPVDRSHPWSGVPRSAVRSWPWVSAVALPVEGQADYNSEFPFGYNDGAVWAGRGWTGVLAGGVAAMSGPLSLVFAPVYFHAQNRAYVLRDNAQSGIYLNGDAFSAHAIDQPQRFGDAAYQRFDLGNSEARLDVGPAAAGISSAPMHWGPARDHPILFGNNAPGFTHVFLGSSHPLDLWLFRVHGRLIWGKLYGTPYARINETEPARYGTGLVGVIVPRGAPGLEIGGGRFLHLPWSRGVLSRHNLTLTLNGLFVSNTDPGSSLASNQIASLFARWAMPAGFEVYGEYGREDHAADLRDFELEPDHNSGYLLGFQRVLKHGADRRSVIRGELLNTRVSGLVISREQTTWYTHLPVAQGHTNLGQVLGSIAAFGGGASTLAFDRYSRAGRWTTSWSRLMRAQDVAFPSGVTNPQRADVQHVLSFNGLRYRAGGRAAVSWEATYVYELNRNLQDHDARNLRLATGLRYVW